MTGRTIVYLPNWIGDMVMAVPFLHALRACSYDEIWAVGKTSSIHLYDGLGLIDRLISIEDRGITAFLDTTSLLRKADFKRAIALPHSFRSAFFFYNLRIKERIGYSRNARGFMLTHKVEENKDSAEPTVEHYLKVLDVLGISRSLDTPILLVTDDQNEKFDEVFADVRKPYCVFVAGAQYGPSKCWPAAYFSELANKIVDKYGMPVYMLPAKHEEELAHSIMKDVRHSDMVHIRSMNVRDMKVCLSRASFVVSNDTGPRHISAALSVPTVVLLGPMDDIYTAYPTSFTHKLFKEDVPCRPCNKRSCDKGHECLNGIHPDQVMKQIEAIIEKPE